MATSVGTVSIDLVAKYATLESDMGRAVAIMDRSSKQIVSMMQTAAIAVAGFFSVKGIVDFVEGSIEAADAIGKMSQKTAISTETLSAWSTEAKKAGLDTDTFAASLTKLNKNADEATSGNKGAQAAFQRIGISVADLKKLSPEDLFRRITDSMSQYKDSAAKTAEAQALFGKQGAAMIPMLNNGVAALDEAKVKAGEFGTAISKDFAKQAGEFTDQLADLGTVSKGVANQIAGALLPALKDLAGAAEDYFKSADWAANLESIRNGATATVQFMSDAWMKIKQFVYSYMATVLTAGEYIQYTWETVCKAFDYMWEDAINYVKKLWQGMIEEMSRQAGSLPFGVGDAMQASLQKYAASIGVVDNLSEQHNKDAESRARQHAANLEAIDSTMYDAFLKAQKDHDTKSKAIEVAKPPTQTKDMPGGIDQGALDKQQAALDALQKALDTFYAKNLESGDKVQDQQAQSIRQLDALGAAAITAGVSVEKVQTMMKDGIEQIALAAQKARDEENRQFDDYVKQQQDKLAIQKADYALQAAAVGMSDKEIKDAQALLQIQRDTNTEMDKALKARDANHDDAEYQRRVKELTSINDERVKAYNDANDQLSQAQENWLNGAGRAYKNFMDQAKDVAGQTADVMTNAFSSFTDAFANMLTTGTGHFKSFATSVLSDLAKMETRVAMSKILTSIFGEGGNPFQMWGGVALGGVFPSHGDISNLSGGVYNSPQLVKFAAGGAVLGEAGFEGVLPLSRNSQGKLGVMASGGGQTNNVSVVVNIDNSGASKTNATSNDDQTRTLGNMIAAKTKEVIASEQRPGGILWRSVNA
jgi:lambda family phage tail tape measure protein